jgi:benzoyl-CoA reductase subunit D
MITAGIDVGLKNIKAVVLKDGKVAGKANGISGGAGRPAAAQAVYDKALAEAGVQAGDVAKVISTGKGKFDVPFAADQLSETVTAAKAARVLVPGVTSVVDIGADEIVVAVLAEDNKITEFVINEKCTAGLGLLLDGIADRFDMSIEEIGALEGPGSVSVNDGCVVFAELDALSLLNRGADAKEIVKAINEAIAWRANSTLNDIYKPDYKCVALFGGMTKNGAFIKSLKRISGIEFVIPEDAEYAGAFGAAAIAAD